MRYSVQRHKLKGGNLCAAPLLVTLVLPYYDLRIGIRQTLVWAYLRNSWDLVLDHCNKSNIVIKQVTNFFGFPMHIKVVFTQYCSLLNVP